MNDQAAARGRLTGILSQAFHPGGYVAVAGRLTYEELAQRVQELEGLEAERGRAEAALAESERRYRLLAESMSDIIWIANMDLRFTYVSPSVERFIGYAPEELIGKSIVEHLTATASEAATHRFLETIALDAGKPVRSNTMVLNRLDKNGNEVCGEVSFAFLRDAEGKPTEVVGITRDVTRQKRAEAELRESEARFRAIFEGSLDAILLIDPESGQILDANPTASELLQRPHHEIVGLKESQIYALPLKEDAGPILAEHVREHGQGGPVEVLVLRPDGREVPVEVLAQIIQINGVPVFLGIYRDLTERKRTQEELSKAQRIESLGILAGGIAHDFNNILTAILTNISMAKAFGNLPDDILSMLSDAENASLSARQLTHRLLTFAKGGTPNRKTLFLRALLKDTVEFALSGSRARCEFRIPDGLWPVQADEGQLSQVIQNLVINASQAMPRGGSIKVCAQNMTLGEKDVPPLKKGRYLKVSIADEGTGIAEKHLPHIFDPFFTTKQAGRGLGLATAFSIIRHHGGHIGVDSELGVGTIFRVYLPAAHGTVRPRERESNGPVGGEGKVLLIDDATSIRRSASQVLQRLGYEVEVAESHEEGIKLYERAYQGQQPFDLVIMDLTIPGGMGGQEAIKKLRRIDPNLKAIASSGYSAAPLMSRFREYGFSGAVAKPYSIVELAETIHRVLQGRGVRDRAGG